jgi:hypothetical protein
MDEPLDRGAANEEMPEPAPAAGKIEPAAPNAEAQPEAAANAELAKPPVDWSSVTSVIDVMLADDLDEDRFAGALKNHLEALAAKYHVDQYRIIYLLDTDELQSWHSNRIYKAASSGARDRPILLVVDNLGGSIGPGYLISKTCKQLAHEKFVVAVPRKAKSAATLLSLGADEIHMGLMSELGPIDPQIGGFPALGMKNALEILSELACRFPGASTMLADYMKTNLDMRYLGYVERINESAKQYAERLLAGKTFAGTNTAQSLATHFVNHYKDHSFVIDSDEACGLMGPDVIKQETPEYGFANAVYESFDLIRFVLGLRHDKDADLVGDGKPHVFSKKKSG